MIDFDYCDIMCSEMQKMIQIQEDLQILKHLKLSAYRPRNIIEHIYILALKEKFDLYHNYEDGEYVVYAHGTCVGNHREEFRFVFDKEIKW